MNDNIYKAAVEFQRLMNCEFRFVIGAKGQKIEVPLRFDEYSFHHLCGIHKLKDIIKSNINREEFFNKVLNASISDTELKNSKFYVKEGVGDRIKCVVELSKLLENVQEVYKFNSKANPVSKINGDILFKWLSNEGKNIYFVLKRDFYSEGQYFGLSIFSRLQSERDFAARHTRQTLLFVSRTPLTADKQLIKDKEEVLYQRPSYIAPTKNNIKIIKFEAIPYGSGNAVAIDNSHSSFFGGIKDFFARKIEEVREIRALKKEIKALSEKSERDNQAHQEEISELGEELERVKGECKAEIVKKESELRDKGNELNELRAKYNIVLRDKDQAQVSNEKLTSLVREVNAILNANPELKAKYIKARDEFRKHGRSADKGDVKPPDKSKRHKR